MLQIDNLNKNNFVTGGHGSAFTVPAAGGQGSAFTVPAGGHGSAFTVPRIPDPNSRLIGRIYHTSYD